ncbi:helix-turn-helix domain-containing protein [Streptomyces avermitilis]|uniref:helix-turn-helix domain-containing protein n=1 Tax=Streptomyces avermitilis TaxID=33903 RepID=UPI0036CC8ABE
MAAAQREIWTGTQLQRLLAERAGLQMSSASVSALFSQEPSQVKMSTLIALCTALDCTPTTCSKSTPPPSNVPRPRFGQSPTCRRQSPRGAVRCRLCDLERAASWAPNRATAPAAEPRSASSTGATAAAALPSRRRPRPGPLVPGAASSASSKQTPAGASPAHAYARHADTRRGASPRLSAAPARANPNATPPRRHARAAAGPGISARTPAGAGTARVPGRPNSRPVPASNAEEYGSTRAWDCARPAGSATPTAPSSGPRTSSPNSTIRPTGWRTSRQISPRSTPSAGPAR